MRRTPALLLGAVLLGGLAGCGAHATDVTDQSPQQPARLIPRVPGPISSDLPYTAPPLVAVRPLDDNNTGDPEQADPRAPQGNLQNGSGR